MAQVVPHLELIDQLDVLIKTVERELTQLSMRAPWIEQSALLIQLSGIGLISAMSIVGAIGVISRLPAAKKQAGYNSGLAVRVHDSGQTHHRGRITKEGRWELRTVMIEAAWNAVRYHAHWWEQFQPLAARIGEK